MGISINIVVRSAFDLTVSEAKTETMCLRTRGIPDATTKNSRPDVQTSAQFCIPRRQRQPRHHDTYLSIEVGRRTCYAWRSFRKYTLELYDRPSAALELKNRNAELRSSRDKTVRLHYMETTLVPL